MKKILTVFLSLVLFATVFTVGTSADFDGEYLITHEGEIFTLSRYEGGEPVRIASAESLAAILGELSREGGTPHAVLDSIAVSGDLTLARGSYTLSGTLTVSDGILSVPEGADISFSSLSLKFLNSGYLFIKGGAVSAEGLRISADGERAVLLNHSSKACFDFFSGEIIGSYSEAAITVRSGSLSIFGGSIVNRGGVGVLSDTGLFLSGAPSISGVGADIKTSEEISLSSDAEAFHGSVTVVYDGLFQNGTLTPLFYDATAESIRDIRLFDRTGKEHSLTYFVESRHASEKNFAAVYLPYSLKYFVEDSLYYEEYYISGESPVTAPVPERDGYTSLGWYERGAERPYEASAISSDLSLYSRYELIAPTFSISSLFFTYDTECHILSFDSLAHPLLDDGAYLTYEWKRGGQAVSSAPSLSVTSVSDSGEYSVTVTLHFDGDSVAVTAENIGVEVLPKVVSIPEIPGVSYTGKRLYPSPIPSSLYTYSETYGIGAGTYPVIFSLIDPENYKWDGTDSDTVSVDFIIEKAENEWIEPPKIFDTYCDKVPKIQGKSLFGELRVSYSSSEVGPYSETLPDGAGEYYARFYVEETSDYSSITSAPSKFKIIEDTVTSLKIESYARESEYLAFSHFSPDGLVLVATYKSGREELVSADKIRISYNGKDSLWAGDKSVTLSYGGSFISHPVSVSPIEYDLSGILFSDSEAVYDGSYRTVNATLPNIVGLDGIPLCYTLTGGGADAGSYAVTLSFSSDSKNYKLPTAKVATLTVLPLSVTLTWSATSFIYDGEAKLPVASYTDAYGVRRYPTVTGARYGAGEGYVATAVSDSQNYVFTNSECEFSIAKADYDLSGVYWSDSSFNYNGEVHSVRLFGLPEGLRVVGYTDANHTDAGMYTARATLDYDRENYNEPKPPVHSWVIYPAEYDTSEFYFTDCEAVYDGEAHYPTLVGNMPTGLDGITLSYSFSVGATHVSEGRVPVTVRFFTESKNYVAPAPLTFYVTVLPRGISVSWQDGEFVYDGREKLPRAVSPDCAVSVTGGKTNAGIYTAHCFSLNPDYYILNPEYEFQIKKAENAWQNTPTAEDIYEGDGLSLSGEAMFGKLLFKFFYDEDMLREVDVPTLPGRYYAVAYVPESENYHEITSAPMEFEIIELLPLSFEASVSGMPYLALSSLSPKSVNAYIVYNSGARVPVDFTLLSVRYESGECFHYGDGEVTLSYLGFEKTLGVSVIKRNYDLSGVRWQNTDTVYDGEMKRPTLTGLPSGISVDFYEGCGTEAGEYTVRAHLSYDGQNYNAPSIPDTTLIIRRRTVVPTLFPVVYDGSLHIPTSSSSLYSVLNPEPVRDAGSYTVTVRLSDTKNYAFESGEQALAVFTVLPKVLEVDFPDRFLYLFESDYEFTLTSPEGTVPSDEVEILAKIEGDRVVYSLNNPNYALLTSEGRLIRVPYPSPSFTWTLLFVMLVILLAVLAVLVVVYRYDSIKGALAAMRCKRKMRVAFLREKEAYSAPVITLEPTETFKNEVAENDVRESEESEEVKAEPDLPVVSIDARRADELITDSLAKDLLKRPREFVVTEGRKKGVINVDTLSESFDSGESVDVNILKEKNLVPYDTAYLKVLARGAIDKPLSVKANDFSLAAIKMIALSGGEAIKVVTVKKKRER